MSGSKKTDAAGARAKGNPLKAVLGAIRRPAILATAALAASLVLAAAAVVAALPPEEKGGVNSVAAPVAGQITYHVLPEFIADLKTSRTKTHFVQIAAVVGIPEESVGRVRDSEPMIIADLQACVRDLQRQELSGSAGIERLRAMLISIVDQHIAPANAREVLFTRFLVD